MRTGGGGDLIGQVSGVGHLPRTGGLLGHAEHTSARFIGKSIASPQRRRIESHKHRTYEVLRMYEGVCAYVTPLDSRNAFNKCPPWWIRGFQLLSVRQRCKLRIIDPSTLKETPKDPQPALLTLRLLRLDRRQPCPPQCSPFYPYPLGALASRPSV